MKTRMLPLVPELKNYGRLYLVDENPEGGSGESGQPEGDQAPAGNGDDSEMLEKYRGKSTKELAEMHRNLEEKLGPKLKTEEELASIKNSLTELREALTKKAETNENDENANLEQQHKDYLRKLGVPVDFDFNKLKETVAREYETRSKFDSLEKEFDGKDGRPKFDKTDVSKFALENGLQNVDPRIVYEAKFRKELVDWEIKRALKGNRSPSVPEGQRKGVKNEEPDDLSKLSPEERRERITKRLSAELE